MGWWWCYVSDKWMVLRLRPIPPENAAQSKWRRPLLFAPVRLRPEFPGATSRSPTRLTAHPGQGNLLRMAISSQLGRWLGVQGKQHTPGVRSPWPLTQTFITAGSVRDAKKRYNATVWTGVEEERETG